MSITVNVICFRGKKLSNGESPIMIRVCKDRKTKYKSLGISVKEELWDFDKNKPKPNCPNRDYILKIIIDKEAEYQKKILELKAENKDFTASTLITPKIKSRVKSVSEFCKDLIEEFKLSDKIGNAKVYNDLYTSLFKFTKNKLDIPFSHIDVDFLKDYEKWLRQKGCKDTSISLSFRTLRSLYNKAIAAKYAKRTSYPFEEFKVSKFYVKTEKRAVSKDVIKQIMELDLANESGYMNFSRDIFIFSYLCGGINLTDVANLKGSNIINDRLVYIRQKTGKKINIPLSEKAKAIILKYASKELSNKYLFPILNDETHKTEAQRYRRRKKVLRNVNKNLKDISKLIGVDTNITSYVARHSYATILKNSGVNIIQVDNPHQSAMGNSRYVKRLAVREVYPVEEQALVVCLWFTFAFLHRLSGRLVNLWCRFHHRFFGFSSRLNGSRFRNSIGILNDRCIRYHCCSFHFFLFLLCLLHGLFHRYALMHH
jgi:site-specific recombinase XerD